MHFYVPGKLKSEYKHDAVVINCDMNLAASPAVNVSASVGHGAFALGYNTCFDTAKSALTKHNVALGYTTKAGGFILIVKSSKVLSANIFFQSFLVLIEF